MGQHLLGSLLQATIHHTQLLTPPPADWYLMVPEEFYDCATINHGAVSPCYSHPPWCCGKPGCPLKFSGSDAVAAACNVFEVVGVPQSSVHSSGNFSSLPVSYGQFPWMRHQDEKCPQVPCVLYSITIHLTRVACPPGYRCELPNQLNRLQLTPRIFGIDQFLPAVCRIDFCVQ